MQHPHAKAQFVKLIDTVFVRNTRPIFNMYPMYDQLAMATMLEERVITQHHMLHATVCTDQGLCRGQLVIDWKDKYKKTPNIKLVTKVDTKLYTDMVLAALTT